MDWDALGRELGEWLLDFRGQDIPGLHSSHFSGEKLSPPRVKSITLPCGIPLLPSLHHCPELCSPHPLKSCPLLPAPFIVLFSILICLGVFFCLGFLFLFYYPASQPLLRRQQHKQTQVSETGCRAQPIHTLSWETH